MGKLDHNYIFDLLKIKPGLVALKEQNKNTNNNNKKNTTATKNLLHSHMSMEVARPAAPACDNCSYHVKWCLGALLKFRHHFLRSSIPVSSCNCWFGLSFMVQCSAVSKMCVSFSWHVPVCGQFGLGVMLFGACL